MESMIPKDEFRKSISESLAKEVDRLADEMYESLCSKHAERVDEMVRRAVLSLGEKAVDSALKHRSRTMHEELPECRVCGRAMRFKQRRPMTLRTGLTGEPRRVMSPYYLCDHCHVGVMGLRNLLHLDEDGFTPFLRELSTRAGAIEPFEAASEELLGKIMSNSFFASFVV